MDRAFRQVCRRASTREAFEVAWRSGPFRADDAMAATGLTRSTTLQALDALVALDLLEPAPSQRNGGQAMGRPSRWFQVRPDGGAVVGLDAGQHSMTATLTDLAGEVRASTTAPIQNSDPPHEQDPRARARLAEELVGSLLAAADLEASDVVALGVGVPAPVDAQGRAPEGWRGFWRRMHADLGEVFGRRFPYVRVENDASLAAVAEHHWGAAQGEQNFVAVLATWALGAGVVLDSRLVRGRHGGVGELGFLSLVPSVGDSVGVHQYLTERIAQRLAEGTVPWEHPWSRLPARSLSTKELLTTLRPDDPVSAPLFTQLTARLTSLFGLLSRVYDPAMIVVCGPHVEELGQILDAVRAELTTDLPAPVIVASRLGADVVSLGAAAAARELAGEVAIEWRLARRGR